MQEENRARAGLKAKGREFKKRIVNCFKCLREIRIITFCCESLLFV